MTTKIDIPKDQIEEFCRRNHIRRLALFGSVLRDDFTPDSDIDVLVEFHPDASIGLITLAGLEIELSEMLGRKVEIHTYNGLHPGFKEQVLAEAEVQYDQT